jgi:hypothetical protein
MRRIVWGLFENTFGLIFIGIVVFIATLGMRFGLRLAETFVVRYVPLGLDIASQDKWYLLAFILGVLLIWSWPTPQPEPAWQPSPIRRGRHVTRLPRAAPRAYAARGGNRPTGFTSRGQSAGSKIRRTS